MSRGKLALPALTALIACIALASCGGDEPGGAGSGGLPSAGGGGTLTYALPSLPGGADPLAARGRSARIVSRQVHEPLVATVRGPYGGRGRHPGLATAVDPSPDRRAWTVVLRPGVSFQDGSPLDVEATLANARRWATTTQGRSLLPGLFAADAPRPGVIRLLFDRPLDDVRARLASPRLGLVALQALQPVGGEGARVRPGTRLTGSGPFAYGARDRERVEITRFAGWWGRAAGLGPALDSVAFLAEPDRVRRLALLAEGQVQVAEPLGAAGARAARADPLLRALGGAGGIGVAGSVRGLAGPPAVPQLSQVWLTTIEDGGG